jgi:hypothetical protein
MTTLPLTDHPVVQEAAIQMRDEIVYDALPNAEIDWHGLRDWFARRLCNLALPASRDWWCRWGIDLAVSRPASYWGHPHFCDNEIERWFVNRDNPEALAALILQTLTPTEPK